jgi:hypothetical protein
MPSFAAITLVAPGVRFKAFDIFFTPDFAFANVFICRTSSFVQARRIIFFAFAILFSECFYGGVGLYHGEICSQLGSCSLMKHCPARGEWKSKISRFSRLTVEVVSNRIEHLSSNAALKSNQDFAGVQITKPVVGVA